MQQIKEHIMLAIKSLCCSKVTGFVQDIWVLEFWSWASNSTVCKHMQSLHIWRCNDSRLSLCGSAAHEGAACTCAGGGVAFPPR